MKNIYLILQTTIIICLCSPLSFSKSIESYCGNTDTLNRVSTYWIGEFVDGVALISSSGYFGLINEEGDILCKPKYDQIGFFEHGIALIELNQKYGLIDVLGRELVSPKYEQIKQIENSPWSLVKLNSKWGAIDHSGSIIVDFKYDNSAGTFRNHALLTLGSEIDLISSSGQIIRLPKTVNTAFLAEGVIRVTSDNMSGLMDLTGQLILPIKYNGLLPLKNGFTIYLLGEKRGILKNGQTILSREYDYIEPCEIGFKIGENSGNIDCTGMSVSSLPIIKWGLLDSNAQLLIPCKYDQIGDFVEGFATVMINNSCTKSVWGAINSEGKEIIPLNYQFVGDYQDELFCVNRGGKSEYLNTSGEVKLKLRNCSGNDFSDGLALIEKRHRIGVVDSNGRKIVRPCYSSLDRISKSSFVGINDNRSSFIVVSKSKSIKTHYDNITELPNGVLKVEKSGVFGIIDSRTGRVIIPIVYTDIKSEENGSLFILKKSKSIEMDKNTLYTQDFYFGLSDLSGEILVRCVFNEILSFSEGFAPIRGAHRWGVISKTGEMIVPLEYSYLWQYKNGVAAVQKDGKWGGIDVNGNVVIPIEFDKDDYNEVELDFFRNAERN